MKLRLKENFTIRVITKVELIVNGTPNDLQRIKNFVIFHEDLPEEALVEKLFNAFNDAVISIEFKETETFSTLWLNE